VAAAAVLVAGETELSMVEAKLAVDMHGVSNMSLNFWPLPKWEHDNYRHFIRPPVFSGSQF